MAYLRDLGKLIELELREADVSDAGLAHLAELKELRMDRPERDEGHQDEGLKHLKGLEELRRLTLEDTQIQPVVGSARSSAAAAARTRPNWAGPVR